MKVIDLLNEVVKGKPIKKFKFKGDIFNYYENASTLEELYYYNNLEWLSRENINLNDEVEIIEEEKKIEKLDVALLGQCDNWLQDQVTEEKSRFELNPYIIDNIRENTLYFQKKTNEIIDVINEMRNKEC